MLFKSISGSAYTKSKTSVIRYVQLLILIMLILSGMLFSSCSSVSKLVSGSNDDTTSDTKKEKFIPFPEKWLKNAKFRLNEMSDLREKKKLKLFLLADHMIPGQHKKMI